MISLSTPFSFETASTAIKISLFIALKTPDHSGRNLAFCIRSSGKLVRPPIDFNHDRVAFDRFQHSRRSAAAHRCGSFSSTNIRSPDEPLEMRALAQDPIESRAKRLPACNGP